MNRYVPETLREMGHEAAVFDFRAGGLHPLILKKINRAGWMRYMDERLVRMVEETAPDAFLAVYGLDHGPRVFDALRRKGVPTICWWLNDPFQFSRSAGRAGLYDYYFTNSRGVLPAYRELGLKNVHYLPVGIYPPVHRKMPGETPRYEVCFAGDWSPVREEVIGALAADFDVSIFGPWKKRVGKDSPLSGRVRGGKFFSPEAMAGLFNRSRVVLNIHSWFGKWDYGVNPRLFEANGCGSFQVCDFKREIPELYEDGKEIVLYGSLSELKEKLEYYLAHENERRQIAENALSRSHKEHTYRHRLAEMLSVCSLT